MNERVDAAATIVGPADVELDAGGRLALYLAVGLGAGAVIALQIDIMRVFAVGNWTHFGSLVVSLAMLGFGLTSAVMAIAKNWFARHWLAIASVALGLLGPLAVGANLYIQRLGFNPIYLVSDPNQKWKLAEIFLASLTPFLAGAVFLGCVFLKSNKTFGRVYFADLAGSGLSGLVFLGAMYVFPPVDLIAAPLTLWAASCLAWTFLPGARRAFAPFVVSAVVAFGGHFVVAPDLGLSRLAVNDYKGASYARRLPEAKKVYESWSPFGFLEAYSTSYLHFAPGLSDNAGFNLPEMPANAYLGLYIDSDGPIGVMRHLTEKESAYFHYLPMDYPYVIKKAPKTFIVQFGGGISTEVALSSGSKDVTVAEGNRAILEAFRSPVFRNFTDDILSKVHVVDYEGRHFLAQTKEKFDVIDLSLADSTGLSNPGGFAVVEKFAYTEEAMETYMRALADGGVLAVTIWNKEEPPKSVLKLYATMAAASRALDGDRMANSFFVASSYLSTATVLYKRGGFSADEIAALRKHSRDLSFDEIYSPGFFYDGSQTDRTLDGYVAQFFSTPVNGPPSSSAKADVDPTAPPDDGTGAEPGGPPGGGDEGRAAFDRHGPPRLAYAGQRRLGRDRQALRLRHAQADQRRALFRRLREDQGPAAGAVRPRPARTAAGRVGLSADLGDARRRLRHRRRAAGDPGDLGLAVDLRQDAGQGAERRLFRLPRRRLHHGRGRPDRPFRHGAGQSDRLRLDPDHRHAGVLGAGGAGLGAHIADQAPVHAGAVPRRRRAADRLRALSQRRARRDRLAALCGAAGVVLRLHRAARLPDGLPDADRDDDARPARQGAPVHLGVGRQRLLLGDRRRRRAGARHQFRPRLGDRDRRLRLPAGAARFLRGNIRRRAATGGLARRLNQTEVRR